MINEYLPYADELIIDVDSNELASQQEIWKDILADNNKLKFESKEIIKKEKYFNNFRIIKMIKNGKMNFDWYYNIERDCLNPAGDMHKGEYWESFRLRYLMSIEKIILIKPYVILGIVYTTTDNSRETINIYGSLIDSRGIKYDPINIIGAYGIVGRRDRWIKIIKGEQKRVYYIFSYIESAKLKCGAFVGEEGQYLKFNSK